MINYIYKVVDSNNKQNNRTFTNDYKKACEYLQSLHNRLFLEYSGYTSDPNETKFIYMSENFEIKRVIEIGFTIKKIEKC